MGEFVYAFERINEPEPDKRFVFLTLREFDIFFSATPPKVAQKALAWSEFFHREGGKMIRRSLEYARNNGG